MLSVADVAPDIADPVPVVPLPNTDVFLYHW